jgi:hypothetical protein
MLTIEEYLNKVFEIVRINAGLEEIRRISTCYPADQNIQSRESKLYAKRDKIMKELDKEHKPVELAPVEQYIDIELQYTK